VTQKGVRWMSQASGNNENGDRQSQWKKYMTAAKSSWKVVLQSCCDPTAASQSINRSNISARLGSNSSVCLAVGHSMTVS
jgi:hypothetical protein